MKPVAVAGIDSADMPKKCLGPKHANQSVFPSSTGYFNRLMRRPSIGTHGNVEEMVRSDGITCGTTSSLKVFQSRRADDY
jgi:hypothetical protein